MKKFIELSVAVKSYASMIFAGLVIVYTVFGGFLGLTEIPFALIWQAMCISALAGILHLLAFTDHVFTKLSLPARFAAFGMPMFAILCGFAAGFHWFSIEYAVNWLIFLGVYLFFFGVITVVFNVFFRLTGKKYTELLGEYQKRFRI